LPTAADATKAVAPQKLHPFSLSAQPAAGGDPQGWAFASQAEWTSFSPSLSSGLGSHEWQRRVLRKDPPCLTLNGPQLEESTQLSDGRMHSAAKAPAGSTGACAGAGLAGDVLYKEGAFGVRAPRLDALFADLLAGVRYPPTGAVEFAWRVSEMPSGERPKVTPEDLRGMLPERPFRLLDNRSDAPAAQPPRFGEFQLRPEQLRSLAWMLAREGVGAGIGEDGGAVVEENEPFVVEWRRYWNPDEVDESGGSLEQVVAGALVRLRPSAASSVWARDTGMPVPSAPSGTGTVHKEVDGNKGRLWVEFSGRLFSCLVEDLEFAGHGQLAIGSRVRVAAGVQTPSFGWGGVTPGMVGIVLKMGVENTVAVRFPVHASWKGKCSELELADACDNRTLARPRVVIDLRVRACYQVRGGILADKVGYGKTATTIALIDSTLSRPAPELPLCDRGDFIPAKGTLIVVPSNLFEQWLQEVGKFLWAGKNLRGSMQKGWSPKGCPLRIFAMSNVTPLTKVKAQELAEADVVVCSYRLLFSPIYQDRRRELAGDSPLLVDLALETGRLVAGVGRARSGRKGDNYVSSWQDLEFPILEQFFWRRIVFDEFHELESFDSQQQNSLQHLRASYRWGLTGTPPVDCSAGVIFMSSLFRVDLPGYLTTTSRSSGAAVDLSTWEADRLLAEGSGRFLDEAARQNTAELPHLRLQEHVIVVHHTMAERALYLGQAHDAPDVSDPEAFQSEASTQALERLLKLCSHFQAAGDNVASAKEECERIGEQKERRLAKARNQVSRCCRVQLLLEALFFSSGRGRAAAGLPRAWRGELGAAEQRISKEGDAGARIAQLAAKVAAEAALEPLQDRIEALDGHRPRDERLAGYLLAAPPEGPGSKRGGLAQQWMVLWEGGLGAQELEQLLEGQAKEQAQNLQELLDASKSLDYFRSIITSVVRGDSAEARNCSICFGEDFPLTALAVTPCAHTFCLPCLQEVVAKLGRCSLCNQKLTQKDVRPLAQEIPFAVSAAPLASSAASSSSTSPPPPPSSSSSLGPAVADAPGASAAASSSSSSSAPAPSSAPSAPAANLGEEEGGLQAQSFGKYGTKLSALVGKLQQLRREDLSAKVILFVQFDDLKRKVAAALAEFGIPAVQLQGAVSQRSAVIRDWQHNPTSDAFVLLLSLAQSASGTNLTAASHVVFLHPMLASTPERAVAHELQAIGRARRHGQKKDVVHVWRFVTADTVEQALTQRHQSELWAREQTRGLAVQGAAVAASEGL